MFNPALSEEREVRGLFLFFKFYFKFIAVSQSQFCDSFDIDKQSNYIKYPGIFQVKYILRLQYIYWGVSRTSDVARPA